MTRQEFDIIVGLMTSLAYRAAGDAIHQRRAGSEDEDIERAWSEIEGLKDT